MNVGEAIALLIASKRSEHTLGQRLDALVSVLEAADEGHLDFDGMEVLLDAGLSRDNRRSLVDQLSSGRITLSQVREAVIAAKRHQAKSQSKAS